MPILLEIIGEAAEAERIARALDGAGPFRARACDLAAPAAGAEAAPDFLLFLRRGGGQGASPDAEKEMP